MSDKSKKAPTPAKPAGKAEQEAANQTTKDGLEPGRENTPNRQEVRQQKTQQGLPNRG
jgi:hypothetical protein